MNKEEIERIALGVAKEMPDLLWEEGCIQESGILKQEATEFAARFLARIDAERGKDALGYDAIFNAIGQAAVPSIGGIAISVIAFKAAIGGEIFLSPTIPDEVSYHNAPGCLNTGDKAMWTIGWNACRDAMLASAQGERNAD